jgi:fatty-acyl-CoA synthase
VVVPINPMNLADELRHYIEDAGTTVAISGQELEERVKAQPALKHVLYAAYSDYVREKTDLPLPDFVRAPARSRSWRDAVGAGLAPGPHLAQPEDLAVMPYITPRARPASPRAACTRIRACRRPPWSTCRGAAAATAR